MEQPRPSGHCPFFTLPTSLLAASQAAKAIRLAVPSSHYLPLRWQPVKQPRPSGWLSLPHVTYLTASSQLSSQGHQAGCPFLTWPKSLLAANGAAKAIRVAVPFSHDLPLCWQPVKQPRPLGWLSLPHVTYLSAGSQSGSSSRQPCLHVEGDGGDVVPLPLLHLPSLLLLARLHQPLVVVAAQRLQLRVHLLDTQMMGAQWAHDQSDKVITSKHNQLGGCLCMCIIIHCSARECSHGYLSQIGQPRNP